MSPCAGCVDLVVPADEFPSGSAAGGLDFLPAT